MADEGQADPAETIQEMELRSTLLDLVQDLSEREQLVLSLYYHEGLTLKEIGQVLGVSESRICQLHGRAVLALRGRLLGREQSAAGAGMAFPGREN